MRAAPFLFLLALLSLAEPLAAQTDVSDSSTRFTPVTEAEFLSRYGASDSTRALIRYWFARRRTGRVIMWSSVGLFVGGAVWGSAWSSHEDPDNLGAIGGAAYLASIPTFFVGLSQSRRYAPKHLQRSLERPERITDQQWAKALRRAQRRGELTGPLPAPSLPHQPRRNTADSLASAANAPAVSQQVSADASGLEARYLQLYGTSDSTRALIRWWFTRRREGAVLITLGSVVFTGGMILIASQVFEPNRGNAGPTVLFTAGLGSIFAGGLTLQPRSLRRLDDALQSPQSVSGHTWRRVFKGDSLVAPPESSQSRLRTPAAQFQPAPTAPSTADEALRLQQDYLQKKKAARRRARPTQ